MNPDSVTRATPSSAHAARAAAPTGSTTVADARTRTASPPAAPVRLASTANGVTVATRPGESVEVVRTRALTRMAKDAGLTPTATQEFVTRAAKLDSGGLNAPAVSDTLQAQPRTSTQAQQAITRGEVTVAPTQAQAGLLKLLHAHDDDPNLCVVPSGMAIGTVLPPPSNRVAGVPGQTGVTPEVAQSILQNVTNGEPPFKPELGQVGGVSWFTTEGEPYVGTSAEKNVTVPVEVANTTGKPVVQFNEARLLEIYNRQMTAATQTAEQQLRERTGKVNGEPLSNRNERDVSRNASRVAERAMWTEVGETVRASESGIGKVTLQGSAFSRSADGEFTLTSRAENVRLPKGATSQLVEAIKARGVPAEPGVLEAAEQLAAREKWVGRVQGAFRVGGKVLIVVGVATDAYRIYTATDKVKTSVEVAGGWAGAAAAGGAFAAWYAPADVAGPWAWLGHGAGTLVAGGVGYFAGSNAARELYELTVEGQPLNINLR
jgi:hypothetical protein